MTKLRDLCVTGVLVLAATWSVARADMQEIAPGTGIQNATVIDTGANGVCESTATLDDIQATIVGQASPNQNEIRCGTNKVSESTAAGDDIQLVPLGNPCNNPNVAVVDSGPDGIANSAAAGDDVQLITVGTGAPNAPCVITGPNGTANTAAPVGDDVQIVPLGGALPNQAVIRCGPNKIPETAANNVVPGGDDVQVTAVSGTATCANANTVVVDSGANGIAETRAIGSELVLKVGKPIKLKIRKGHASVSKTVKVQVSNQEFGTVTTPAPASRTYQFLVTDGSCPAGTVGQVDSDGSTAGLQTTGTVLLGGRAKGTFVVTIRLQDVTSASTKIPFRCAVDVEVDVFDPALNGSPDDAAAVANNSTSVDLEVVDGNDL